MKIRTFLTIFMAAGLAMTGFTAKAQAEGKVWVWGWGPSHWRDLDFVPYLEDGKSPHNSQWDENEWSPEHWTQQRGSDIAVLRRFYVADVLRDQYFDEGVPVLEVGPRFYNLSGHDKRRVTEMVDTAYGMTASKMFGMYMLYDWQTKKAVGSYTRYGLQIQ